MCGVFVSDCALAQLGLTHLPKERWYFSIETPARFYLLVSAFQFPGQIFVKQQLLDEHTEEVASDVKIGAERLCGTRPPGVGARLYHRLLMEVAG